MMSDRTEILTRSELLAKIDLPALLTAEGHSVHEKGGKLWTSIRDENTPSVILHPPDTRTPFWRWYDFGSGKGGTAIDYIVETRGVSTSDAFRILREIANVPLSAAKVTSMPVKQPQPKEILWPTLRLPTVEEMILIAKVRDVSPEAILLGVNHGIVRVGLNRTRRNAPAWWLCGGGFMQAKTFDGSTWDGKGMKVDTHGSAAGKWISCGVTEYARKIVIVEGIVGIIEVIEAILRADEEAGYWCEGIGALASYNSGTDLSPDQCRYLASRSVFIIGDTGDTGSKAARRWESQILAAGGSQVIRAHAPKGDLGNLLKASPRCPPTLLKFLMNTNPS